MQKIEYPMVECAAHPGPQFGIAVCVHVIEGRAPVDVYEEPSGKAIGLAVCAACATQQLNDLSRMRLICAKHYSKLVTGAKGYLN